MCTSTESTFAWVGAIVINAAFASLVAWGASTLWQLGFALSSIYTLALSGLALQLDSRQGGQHENSSEGHEPEGSPRRKRSSLVNLLYGLATIALGVTGLFLPINIFYCPDERPPWPPNPPGRWETDIASLPEAVRSWAKSDVDSSHKASFVYLSDTKSTLFSGTDGDTQRSVLWVATASVFPFRSAEPVSYLNISMPYEFVSVSDSKACFGCMYAPNAPAQEKGGSQDMDAPVVPTRTKFTIACSGGKFIRLVNDNSEGLAHQSPHSLISFNGTLWYKDYPPNGVQGTVIFSLDPSTMDEIIHSEYHGDAGALDGGYSDTVKDWYECRKDVERKRAIMALFTSALPMAVASILLWVKKNVSSMGLTAYIGISAVAISVFICVDSEHLQDFLKWWHSVFGALWVVVLTDLFFSKRPGIDLAPLIWGVNFGALAFFIGMVALTDVFEEDTLWRWLLLNLLAFVPLGILGMATGQVFLLFLCALGFLADSFRLASWFIEGADPNSQMPIYFLVLAFAGLCISGLGWFLSHHQAVIHTSLSGWFEQHSLAQVRREDAEYDALPSDGSLSERSSPSQDENTHTDDVEA